MNLDRLKAQLREDEGVRLQVYTDTRGFATVGVGHRVRVADHLQAGDTISPERCEQLFQCDLYHTLADCACYIEDWVLFPEEVQEILANMAFNLGIVGLMGFKRTLALLQARKYREAALALEDSLWYRQVGNRSKRLVARLRALS